MRLFNLLFLFLIFFFPLFFLPFSFSQIEFNKFYFLLFLSWGLILYWLLFQLVNLREIRLNLHKIDFLVLLFLVFSLFSFFLSRDKISSFFGTYTLFNDGLLAFFAFFLFFFLIRQASYKNKALNSLQILKYLIFSSFLVGIFSFFSLLGFWQKIPLLKDFFVFSPATESLHFLSGFLGLGVILGFALFLSEREYQKRNKYLWFLFFFISLFLILVIDSQRAMIFICLSSFLFLISALREKLFFGDPSKFVFVIFIFVGSLIFSFLSFRSLYFYFFQKFPFAHISPELILPQAESFEIAFRTLKSSPKNFIFGSGPATFLENFTQFKSERMLKIPFWTIRFSSAGNFVAEILSFLGILGGGLFVFLACVIFVVSLSKKLGEKEFPLKVFCISSALLPFLFPKSFLLLFLFFLALALFINIFPSKEKRISLKDSPFFAILLEFFLVIFILMFFGTLAFGIRFYLADNYYKKGFLEPNLDKKIEFFQKAVRFNPYQPYYQMVFSQALILRAQEEIIKETPDQNLIQQLLSLAVENAKKAKELSPKRIIFVENLANTYRDLINVAQGASLHAEKNYQEAISLDPKNPFLYNELGKVAAREGNFKKARELFLRAQEIFPDFIDPKIQMALLLEQEGKSDEAISELEKLSLNYPLSPDVFYHLGNIYLRKGNLDKAIENYQIAISIFPNFSNARFNLAIALERKGEFSSALEHLKVVEILNPNNWLLKNKIKELEEKISIKP